MSLDDDQLVVLARLRDALADHTTTSDACDLCGHPLTTTRPGCPGPHPGPARARVRTKGNPPSRRTP